MAIPIRQTKVVLPRRRNEILSRQRLLDQLGRMADKRLVHISAPAGYGKTSLLIDFAYQTDQPVCWLSLDPLDRDIRRFLVHFVAAISHRFPGFGRPTLVYLENLAPGSQQNAEILTTHLVNELLDCTDQDVLILIDDFHHVDEVPEIVVFINRFVLDMGERVHLIAASRSLPSLPDLPLMVARMQIAGLSYEELAFRPVEIQELLQEKYGTSVSTEESHALADAAEGWITGLMLTSHSGLAEAADDLRIARLSGVGLYDFLAHQVVDRLPGDLRQFLLATSPFDEFNAAVCEEVLGSDSDWELLIQRVWRKNLFISVIDKEDQWYRYHPLFRDFLETTFQQESFNDHRQILERLWDRYVIEEDWDKAYEMTMRLADFDRLAMLIDQCTNALTRAGRYATLRDWLVKLPQNKLDLQPRLVALDGILKVVLGEPEAGELRLTQAIQRFRKMDAPQDLADSLIKRTFGYRNLGKYAASIEDAREALSISDSMLGGDTQDAERWRRIRADALRAMGINQAYLGKASDAVEAIELSLALYEFLGDAKSVALTRNDLGFVFNQAGRFRAALEEYEKALDYWNASHNLIQQATILNNRAVAQHALGQYPEAAEDFRVAIEQAEKAGYRRVGALASAGLGDLYTDLGMFEAARTIYGHARKQAEKQGYPFLLFYLDLMESRLLMRLPDRASARQLLARSGQRVQASSSEYEQGLFSMHSGQFAYEVGDYAEAIVCLDQALTHFSANGHRTDTARVELLLAGSYLNTEQHSAAVKALKNAYANLGGGDYPGLIFSIGQLTGPWLEGLLNDPDAGEIAESIVQITRGINSRLPEIRRSILPASGPQTASHPQLSVRAFGQPGVSIDGRDLSSQDWQTQIARDMFFCLLANPTGLSRDALGEIFWPEKSIENIANNVKNTLYRLRQAVGKPTILYTDDRYLYNADGLFFYDVDEFFSALSHARQKTFPDERIPYYQQAAALYRGDYLPDLDYRWANQERQNLRHQYLTGEREYGELLLDQQEFVTALECSYRVLMLEPCEESAHRCAMLANYGLGNTAGIVRQYRRCEKDLHEILDARPSPETRNLYLRLTG